MYTPVVKDRKHAGQILAQSPELRQLAKEGPMIALALPRGGVPVAYEIAQSFHIPLDVMIVRKLGLPFHPEVAMGAISVGNVQILNQELIRQLQISEQELNSVLRKEKQELERRNQTYRKGKPFPSLSNHIVLIVDDGIATGATMKAAILAAKQMHPSKVVAVSPVGPPDSVKEIQQLADIVICPHQPLHFNAVGLW